MPFETRLATLAAAGTAGFAVLLVLSGCASTGAGASDAPAAASEQASAPPVAPWEDGATSAVVVEFERDGEAHTLSGEIPFGLLSCSESGMIAISSKAPDPAIGVMFSFEPETPVVASVWIIDGDYAAQLQAKSVVSAAATEGGGMSYSAIDASARASVLPSDVAKSQLSGYDFAAAEQVDATVSFLATCPAE